MSEQKTPLLSVILPVYNGAPYIAESIESILDQDFRDFELIIVNDGCTDGSDAVIRRCADPRIIYISQENRGLAATLNRAIGVARGRYIARQDQDDISLPSRFTKQICYLEVHPECGLLGTWAKIFSDVDARERYHRHPFRPSEILYDLLFDNPFVHSSVMLRKSVFDTVGLYCTDRNRQPPEDYELWSRVARIFQVANLPEVLVLYREVQTGMSKSGVNPFSAKVYRISRENIAMALDLEYASPVISDLADLVHANPDLNTMKSSYRTIRRSIRKLGEYCQKRPGTSGSSVRSRERITLLQARSAWLQNNFGKTWGSLLFVPDRLRRKLFHVIGFLKGKDR